MGSCYSQDDLISGKRSITPTVSFIRPYLGSVFLLVGESVFTSDESGLRLFDVRWRTNETIFMREFSSKISDLVYDSGSDRLLVNTEENCFFLGRDDRLCVSLPYRGVRKFTIIANTVVLFVQAGGKSSIVLLENAAPLVGFVPFECAETGEFRFTIDPRVPHMLFVAVGRRLVKLDILQRELVASHSSNQVLGSLAVDPKTGTIFAAKPQKNTVSFYSMETLYNLKNWRLGHFSPTELAIQTLDDKRLLYIIGFSGVGQYLLIFRTGEERPFCALELPLSDVDAKFDTFDLDLVIVGKARVLLFEKLDYVLQTKEIKLAEIVRTASNSLESPPLEILTGLLARVLLSESKDTKCMQCFDRFRQKQKFVCKHLLLCFACAKQNGTESQCYYCRAPLPLTNSL